MQRVASRRLGIPSGEALRVIDKRILHGIKEPQNTCFPRSERSFEREIEG